MKNRVNSHFRFEYVCYFSFLIISKLHKTFLNVCFLSEFGPHSLFDHLMCFSLISLVHKITNKTHI